MGPRRAGSADVGSAPPSKSRRSPGRLPAPWLHYAEPTRFVLADDVHRVGRELAQVRLHRYPKGLNGDGLEVRAAISGQRRRGLGIGDGVKRRIIVTEVEGEDGDHVGGVP